METARLNRRYERSAVWLAEKVFGWIGAEKNEGLLLDNFDYRSMVVAAVVCTSKDGGRYLNARCV